MTVTRRGTSNSGKNGSAESRRARKRWLIRTYRADVDVLVIPRDVADDDSWALSGYLDELLRTPGVRVDYAHRESTEAHVWTVTQGYGEAATRCYRCGRLLWFCTLEVDRIHPGWKVTKRWPKGGTYVRENIRPACGGPHGCNIITGNEDRWSSHKPLRFLPDLLALIRGEDIESSHTADPGDPPR